MSGTVLWLIALVAVSFVAAVFLRRAGALASGTRDLRRLQGDLAGLDARLGTIVEPMVGRLDDVRRGARNASELGPELGAALTALRSVADEARTLRTPPALAERVTQIADELDRAVRSADMAAHGIETMSRGRDIGTEAQVALKRGSLGLRHAREAVARLVAGIAALTPAEVNAMPARPVRTTGPSAVSASGDEGWLTGSDES